MDSHWQWRWIYHEKQGRGHFGGYACSSDGYITLLLVTCVYMCVRTLETPGFARVNTLITADAGVTTREAAERFNTLLTAEVAGLLRRPIKHPTETGTKYLVWHFIATLACIRLCFWHHKQHLPLTIFIATLACIHLCFWHCKQCLPLTIPQGQWWHKHTFTQTYIWWHKHTFQDLWYHGDSGETYNTMGTVLRQWWWHKIFLTTKIHDKRYQTTW